MAETAAKRPIVFACAGCSFAGRLAYDLALELDRRGHAEMSCLAGVGAKRKVFLKKMQNRPVWIVDGCPIECAAGVMEQASRAPELHIKLHERGIAKKAPPKEGVDMNALVDGALAAAEPPAENTA